MLRNLDNLILAEWAAATVHHPPGASGRCQPSGWL